SDAKPMSDNQESRVENRKLIVGLIGGIGSGKSQVAALFAERGARRITADELGHEALRQPDIRRRIIERWGSRVLDEQGSGSRKVLGGIVVADEKERRALEAMVFPFIELRLDEEVKAAQNDPRCPLIVVDAAIMLESGWSRMCDRIVFVDVPRELRL